MANILTDEEYYELCKESYDDEILKEGELIKITNGESWAVLESVDNKKSGLQGSALVPAEEYEDIKSGNIEPSNVVFVSRGTESLIDWGCNFTDLGSYPKPNIIKRLENNNIVKITKKIAQYNLGFGLPRKYVSGMVSTKNNQFVEYEEFVNNTVEKYSPKDYSFTGHSLGGALAQYNGVLHDKKTVTYSAAKAYRLLPKEFQEKVESGYYNNKIFNYKHEYDPVGYVPLGKLIGSQLFVKSNINKNGIYPIKEHSLNSFSGVFTENGTMKLLVKSEEIRDVINNLSSNIDRYNNIIREIDNRMDMLDSETNRIYNEFLYEIGSGEFSHLTKSDLDEIFDDIVPYKPNRFYNRDKGEELIYELQNEIKKIEDLLFAIEKGVKDMEEGDLNASNLF